MTTEQLEKGSQLKSLIGSLETNIRYWQQAKGFAEQTRLRVVMSNGSIAVEYINNDYVDFDHLKLVTVAKLQNKLDEAKQQLADL